ncbi:agmatine deiminase family protein [Kitasatospora sp. NPDC101155]|uniref:agmatine deiminase family protein n=1 Tax=Kitasatospora sp. NPDC101155 TaxID=3364097 RepID=UPI003805962D
MSWPASENVWGDQLPDVRRDVTGLAQAIPAREPVVLMARPEQQDAAQKACGSAVEVVPIAVDDLWARDTLPVFVEEGGKVKGIDFNFNGWGGKHGYPAQDLTGGEPGAALRAPTRANRVAAIQPSEGRTKPWPPR